METTTEECTNRQKCNNKKVRPCLSRETLYNIFRWLDRRILETRIRLVSRCTNALVGRHIKEVPRLLIDKIDFTAAPDHGKIHLFFLRPKLPVAVFMRVPFEYCDAKDIPEYIICSSLATGAYNLGGMQDAVEVKYQEETLIYVISLPYRPGVKRYTYLRDIFNRKWSTVGGHISTGELPLDVMFKSPFGRNCLVVDLADSDDYGACLDWLMNRVDGDAVRHLDVSLSRHINIHSILLQPLVRQFQEDVKPCRYHLIMLGQDEFESGNKEWKNEITGETLSLKHFENHFYNNSLVLLRSDGPCLDCYFDKVNAYNIF